MEDADSKPHTEEDRPPLDYDPDYVHTEGYFKGYRNRDIPDEYDLWRKKYQKPVVDFSQVPYLDDRDKGVIDSKAYMAHEILESGDQRFSFEFLDEVKLKPTGEEKLSLYFRDKKIADYYPKTGKVIENDVFESDALEKFKELAEKVYNIRLNVSESSYNQDLLRQTEENPFDFDNFMEELEELKLESEIPQIIKEDAQASMEETISLESTQFKVGIERAKEYQQKIESLEQEIRDLKAQSLSSDEKQRRIDSLERQLENLTEDAKDEIKKLEQSLQLKGHHLLETQKEVDFIQKERESLEVLIQSSEQENEDLLSKLKSLQQRYKTETTRLKTERDSYKTEKENLEKLLKSNVDSKIQEIASLVEENEKLKKQGLNTSSYQESLQKRVSELNDALEKLQSNYDARIAISQDQEETLKENRKDIQKKEQKILDYEKENKRLSYFEKRAEELEGLFNEQKKIIKGKQKELENQKQQYEEQISSLSQEKSSLSRQRDETQSQLNSLETEIKTAEKNKSQLKKERDSKFSQVQEYERQIKKLGIDINVYRNKIQSLETENKTLKTASTKSSQDYSKQLRDIKEKIHREEVKPLQDRIKDLEGSVRNYKGSWDDADKAHKSSLQKYKEDAIKLNHEKKDLVGKLRSKDADYLNLQRKLLANENRFSLLQEKYEKLFDKSEKDLGTLTVERDALLEREKQVIEELKHRRERIEAMTKNAEEYKNQVLELEEEINNAYNKIELNKVKQTQFDKLTSERNDYVQRLNNAVTDRDVLQQKIEEKDKELQELKKIIVPDHVIKQLKHDVQNLNKTLDEKDRMLNLQKKQLKDLNNSQKQAVNFSDNLQKTFENRVKKIRDSYEKELKQIKHNLIQTIRPGELKAIGILLEKVDIQDYSQVDYEPTIKEMRTARDKFRRLAEDPNTSHAKKFLYDHLKDHMEYRIDTLNLEFGKPIETPKGPDVLYNSREGIMRLWYKMLRLLKNYGPSFLVTSLAGIFTWFITTVVTLTHGASKTVVTIVKYVAPSIATGFSAGLGQGLVALAWNVVWSLQWFAQHIYEIIAGGITASFFVYKEYGEETSFPIFAFWSLVLAYALVFISKTLEYTSRVKGYVDSVRSYIPIIGN